MVGLRMSIGQRGPSGLVISDRVRLRQRLSVGEIEHGGVNKDGGAVPRSPPHVPLLLAVKHARTYCRYDSRRIRP